MTKCLRGLDFAGDNRSIDEHRVGNQSTAYRPKMTPADSRTGQNENCCGRSFRRYGPRTGGSCDVLPDNCSIFGLSILPGGRC